MTAPRALRPDEPPARRTMPASWIQSYYWATSLFFLADVAFDANIRAAALPRADLRYAYYVLCFALAFVCRRWPGSAAWVGMGESALNLFLLILSVMLPIITMTDSVFDGGAAPELMTPGKLVNVMFTGTVLWLSFQRSQAAAAGPADWMRRRV